MAIGVLLMLFSLYNLARPKLPEVKGGGQAADVGVGFLNGLVGGSTGLAGILIVIWSNMRGWGRDEQRAAFQPTGVATFSWRRWIEKMGRESRFFSQSGLNQMACRRDKRVGSECWRRLDRTERAGQAEWGISCTQHVFSQARLWHWR
jgi:hypothetical protein